MPGWNTHLEIGNRLADKLNIKGEAAQEFLFWCILPDINNACVNHPHIIKSHEETHYNASGIGHINFYKENKSKIDRKDPVYLGYLFHLFTDDVFNQDFSDRISSSFKDKTDEKLEDLKHNDFWLYGTNFRYLLDFNIEKIVALANQANQIKAVDVNADDILEVTKILELDKINDNIRGGHYIMYTKEDFDNLMDKVVHDFCDSIF